ncbi:MAG TPA: 2-oxoglutarate dehydrogenase E1 component, partial [Burkholderiaceae bacterium]|nr:2-oxoglutarate dehydrogenase E1 component [Burkholderiaceae bacterium]
MMRQFEANSYLFGGNAPYIEELYESYLDNPASVPDQWRAYFDAMQLVPAADGSLQSVDVAHAPVVASFAQRAKLGALRPAGAAMDPSVARKQVHVQSIIAAYRFLGERWADLDPLKRQERAPIPELEPAFYDLTDADMDMSFSASNTYFGQDEMTLRELIQALRQTYCGTFAAEFMYIADPAQKRWIQQRLEPIRSTAVFDEKKKRRILERLTAAEGLGRYLHTKYVGQKRFSLEGGESFIVAMDELIQRAGEKGVEEIVIGMAHRGRLNVLVNTLGKMPSELFAEFEGKHAAELPGGDVKYHNGFSSDVSTPGGPVHLSLAFNPSHLEIVNPVVEGSVRARQERRGDKTGDQVLAVLVHGDAAFAGQGVVMETLNLALTRGYGTGGTVHVVINNQIGFTTSDARDARSSTYCSDVVKMIEAPVFHVNGDDPEAVALAAQIAMDFRQEFGKDVVIDIVCFRKLGHNEQDTPAMTQPLMYKRIGQHPGTRALYADKLVAQNVLSEDAPEAMVKAYRAAMDEGRTTSDPVLTNYKSKYAVDWTPFLNRKWTDSADTAVPAAELKRLAERITTVPENFKVHPLVEKVLNDRRAMGEGKLSVDWGMAEHLAFASLVASGFPVRITGQDSGRGTFTHRHAVLHD